MSSKASRILVTGAGGFIGSHLVEALSRLGHHVTALIHYNAQRNLGNLHLIDPGVLGSLEVVLGDINDPEMISGVVKDKDIVIHLAALIGIPYSYQSPRSYLQTNAEGTLNLLEACRRHGPRRFIFTSTSEVYGSARQVPIDETHPLQAQSPYSASKIAAEAMVEAYQRNFSVPAVTLRPFNTFGPRQSSRAVIPTIISQALKEDSIQLGRTDTVRDFSYVEDTVDGIIAAALADKIELGPYNLGTGTGLTIEDVVRRIMVQLGRSLPVTEDSQRLRPALGEVDRLVSTYQKFQQATGWKPRIDFEDGLRRTIEFWRQHGTTVVTPLYTV